MPAMNFFKFLGIDGHGDSEIAGPHPVGVASVVASRKRAAGTLLVPAHGRHF